MNEIYYSNILYEIGGWTPFLTMYFHLGTMGALILQKYPHLHGFMGKINVFN